MSVTRFVAVVVCLLLLAWSATPTVAAVDTEDRGAVPGATTAGLPVTTSGSSTAVVQANNTTRHRNPEDGTEAGDLGAVQDHLAGEMRRVIVDCSQGIRIGEFDPCEDLNGTYGDSLSKYVEVSRETGATRDDEKARSFREARREGREYARTVREFRETYEAYREARKNGNAGRARRAARELRDLAERTNRTGGNLSRSLRDVTRAGTDVRSASRAVNETTANVTLTVESIEQDLFVETHTIARLDSVVGSFRDPLVVTGRVTTANGTAVPDTLVGLAWVRNGSAGGRALARTRTNATGHYRLVYRPVTVSTGRESFAVRLIPSVRSPYLPSTATMTARIEPVRANLTVDSMPSSSAYADRLRVRTRVTVGGVPVDGLPVTTRIGEYQIGSGRTGTDGSAVPDGRFPAAITPGERTVVVGFEETSRAIAPTTESFTLDVRETATVLEATARRTTDGSVTIEGRLTTAAGQRLRGRLVRVTLAGQPIGAFRTDENGSFDRNLTVPASVLPVEGSADRTVGLAFVGSGTNLASTETTVSVTLLAPEDPSLPGDTALSLSLVALLLVAVAGAVLLGRRSSRGESSASRGSGLDESGPFPGPSIDRSEALAGIRAAMDAGDYDLVTTAGYRAVRRALAGRVAAPPSATHWEFYGACSADGFDPERLDAVRRLTERFERVAFASDRASRSVAAEAIADVERVLEARTGDTDEADGDDHVDTFDGE